MIPTLPKKPDGRDPETIYHQRIWDAVSFISQNGDVAGQKTNRTTRGSFAVKDPAQGGGGSPFVRLIVKEVFDDYLRCRGLMINDDGDEVESVGGSDYYVAKDPALRNSITTENKTGTDYTYTYSDGDDSYNKIRTSDDGDTTEDQVVTPPWMPDEEIVAVKVSRSGVWRTSDNKPQEDITDDDEQFSITLLYMKPDRQWAGPKE